MNNKAVWYGVYLAFTIILTSFAILRPIHNFDMICYAGGAKAHEVDRAEEIHRWVYDQLEENSDSAEFRDFTSGETYRSELFSSAEAFYQQLPFYKIRIAYTSLIHLLTSIGINVFFATHFLSALAVLAGLWVLFFAFHEVLLARRVIALVGLSLLMGIIQLARLSTPDGLAFLVVALISYAVIRSKPWLLLILPLSVLVRTDLILFGLPVFLYLLFYQKSWRLFTLLSLSAMALLYWSVNEWSGNYGWATIFSFTLIERMAYPANETIRLGFSGYTRVFLEGFGSAITNGRMLLSVALLVMTLRLQAIGRGLIFCGRLSDDRIFLLVSASLFYILTHFLLFPVVWRRFFVGQYLLAGLALLLILSEASIKRARSSPAGDQLDSNG